MDSETVAIISIGITLLIAMLGIWRDVKGEIRDLRSEVHAELQAIRVELSTLSDRVSRIEGRLDERDHHSMS